MATAMHVARSNEIKLEYGIPQTFALKYVKGRDVTSNFPGGRVMFTAVDERRLFLNDEGGGDLERGMRELGVRPADFVRVTKIRHPRGGGSSIRVELAEETRLEADLRKSVDRAHEAKRADALPRASAPATSDYAPATSDYGYSDDGNATTAHPQAGPLSPTAVRFMGAYKDAVDILMQTQGYAKAQGLLLNIECADVRCLAATIMIGGQRS